MNNGFFTQWLAVNDLQLNMYRNVGPTSYIILQHYSHYERPLPYSRMNADCWVLGYSEIIGHNTDTELSPNMTMVQLYK